MIVMKGAIQMKLTTLQEKQLREQLIERKQELTKQLEVSDEHGLADAMRSATGELSMIDNHPADIGTELFERGKDLALNDNAQEHLKEVLLALEKLDSGTYGLCEVCHKPIPYQRLEAIPWAAACVDHVRFPNTVSERPVEEEFLTPPFGRTSFDGRGDETEFDGEDAWQIVENYGSSNSPALAEDPDSFDYEHPAIEPEEHSGYVEAIESFLATDLYGNAHFIIRNSEYRKYMESDEGDHGLEVLPEQEQ
jgi:YteA family regulatory protein